MLSNFITRLVYTSFNPYKFLVGQVIRVWPYEEKEVEVEFLKISTTKT